MPFDLRVSKCCQVLLSRSSHRCPAPVRLQLPFVQSERRLAETITACVIFWTIAVLRSSNATSRTTRRILQEDAHVRLPNPIVRTAFAWSIQDGSDCQAAQTPCHFHRRRINQGFSWTTWHTTRFPRKRKMSKPPENDDSFG